MTPGFEFGSSTEAPHLEFKRPDNLNDVVLFYVNSTDQLECVGWQTDDLSGCAGLTDLLPSVSQNSSHISAGLYDFNDGGLGLLLTYQNSSRDLVMMLGYVNSSDYSGWTWQDKTGQLCSAEEPGCPDPEATTCSIQCPNPKATTCSLQSGTILCVWEVEFGNSLGITPANFTSGKGFEIGFSKPLRNIPFITCHLIIYSCRVNPPGGVLQTCGSSTARPRRNGLPTLGGQLNPNIR